MLNRYLSQKLNQFRHSLAYIDALPQLTLLGLIIGVLVGGIIVAFRLAIEFPLGVILPDHSDNFEALPPAYRVGLIFVGCSILITVFHFLKKAQRDISVSHVLDRLHNHQGQLPFTNWFVQFIGGAICMISGQSVGREGPAVHLGAGAASQVGQWLRLPNNSMHTLIGCGVAAAISASFDTPMAGVIFAMEVIVLEYTTAGFVPVILASVMGTAVSRAILGGSSAFVVGDTNIESLMELPLMVAIGFLISCVAAVYIRLHIFTLKFQKHSLVLRFFMAATITSIAAVWVPEIMGLGYDSINQALAGELLLGTLLLIFVAKLIVTPTVIGLGIPGGIIGPSLVIGACMGGAAGLLVQIIFPQLNTNPNFYVMMGMAGMMAAVINAPLASLVAVLELSYNPNMIFPAMLIIVVACVFTRQLFRLEGIFMEQLNHNKRELDFGPARQALRRAGVRSIMDTRFVTAKQFISKQVAIYLLSKKPMWLIIFCDDDKIALRAADLANHIEALNEKGAADDEEIDLLEIAGRRYKMGAIHESFHLLQGLQEIERGQKTVFYVYKLSATSAHLIQGIITLSSIENYYQPRELRHVV